LPAQSVPAKRTTKIFQQIDKDPKLKAKPDTIILVNGSEPHFDLSFFYVSGFPKGLFEKSFLVARRDASEVAVFTSPLEEEIARANGAGIDLHTRTADQREELKRLIPNADTIGVNETDLTVDWYRMIRSVFKQSKIVNVGPDIVRARSIKDESEIKSIEQACAIASKAYSKIPELLEEGAVESQIAANLVAEMQNAGGSGVAFESIVSFGKNSALPHYTAGDAKLKPGQFVLLDYGTKVRRYCSDITRTLIYGTATSQQKKMYELVKEANAVGAENCLAGNKGSEVHSSAAKIIDESEFKGRFIHSLGHPLGLAVHDPGVSLSLQSQGELEPGMVLTVEPGIYMPGLGGVRIEDDVLVTKNKPRVLTSAERNLIEA
jgi:Xaa-Pro dipeptidase